MKKVVIYTTTICPFCVRAKMLLDRKKIRNQMIKKAGGAKTVPQIFIGNKHVGGSDDLYVLDKEGELDKLL